MSLNWEDPLGGGNGNPLQYSCLEKPMDKGAWQATVHGVAKSRTQLSDFSLYSLWIFLNFKIFNSKLFKIQYNQIVNKLK